MYTYKIAIQPQKNRENFQNCVNENTIEIIRIVDQNKYISKLLALFNQFTWACRPMCDLYSKVRFLNIYLYFELFYIL